MLLPLVTRTMSNRKLATSINSMHIHYNILPANCFCSSVIDDFMVLHKLHVKHISKIRNHIV